MVPTLAYWFWYVQTGLCHNLILFCYIGNVLGHFALLSIGYEEFDPLNLTGQIS